MTTLGSNGFACWIFGGWAEELHGAPEREHGDIDLLYRSTDFQAFDKFAAEHGMPMLPRRFAYHKRTFSYKGTPVDLNLVEEDRNGLFTDFCGFLRCRWPEDALVEIDGLPVANKSALWYAVLPAPLRPLFRYGWRFYGLIWRNELSSLFRRHRGVVREQRSGITPCHS